jgi:CRISPR system Cascade subunit CasE
VADPLYLVRIPLRPDKLVGLARSRALPLRDVDEGYLCHCVMRELWQERAPAPFVIRPCGGTLDIWGYSSGDARSLVEHARAFGDPSLVAAIGELDGIASKEMPAFQIGRRLGFLLRACPVVRLAQCRDGDAAGAEVDAYLARCFAIGKDVEVSREQVYRDWLTARVHQMSTGAALERVRVTGFSREQLIRRTQGSERRARRLERPDVRFEGDMVVVDGERFREWVAHGVGRHRAFGFGAIILVPLRTTHAV